MDTVRFKLNLTTRCQVQSKFVKRSEAFTIVVMRIKSSVMLRRVDCLTLKGSAIISETSVTIYQ